jgi:hypothetical protein
LLREPGGSNRKTLAITTAVRNAGVALVIASSLPGPRSAVELAVTAATAYGLFQTVGMALVALGWGRLAQTHEPPIDPVAKGAVS